MPNRGATAKGGVDWDRSNGPNRGRIYATYIDSAATDNPATNVFVKFSDDSGVTWSQPIQVNDDTSGNSHLVPRVRVDQTSGFVMETWYDARNDLGQGGPGDLDMTANNDLEIFAALSTDGGLTWAPNLQVSQNASSAVLQGGNNGNDFGDYIGLAFNNGVAEIGWADNSADTAATNPDAPNFDIGGDTITIPGGSNGPGPNNGPPGGPGAGGGDRFEPNETSDRPALLGMIGGPFNAEKQLTGLGVVYHANGLPDYDWYRLTACGNGTFTCTTTPAAGSGPLECHVFTVTAAGALQELKSTNQLVQGQLVVSMNVRNNEPLYVEVKGAEISSGQLGGVGPATVQFGQGGYDMDVKLG